MPKQITEIISVQEIFRDIPEDTLLVLDLDNTVMTSRLELGGDAWFTSLITDVVTQHEDQKLAMVWAITLYSSVQSFIRTRAVEPEIVDLVKSWQDKGHMVIGLTARNSMTIQGTLNQLSDIGIDFSKNCNIPNEGTSFVGGIIFCGGGHKGDHLVAFLKQHRLPFSHITMMDDKRRHLEDVQAALEHLDIGFNGYRYGFLDPHVEQFDRASANSQLSLLAPHLPVHAQEAVGNLKLNLVKEPSQYNISAFADGFFYPISHRIPSRTSSTLMMGSTT